MGRVFVSNALRSPHANNRLGDLKRARRQYLDLAVLGECFARDFKRRRNNGQRAVVKIRVRYASDVPELSENRPAGLVTASVIFLRPATCAGECKPGVRM
jgi:hypothetical protein